MVTTDYVNGFKRAILQLSPVANRFRILDTFDASKASDPSASPALKNKLQTAFVHRVHGIINKTTNKDAKDHYLNWLKILNLPIPEPETESIEPEEQTNIETIEEEDIEEDVMSENEILTPPVSPVPTSQQAPELSL